MRSSSEFFSTKLQKSHITWKKGDVTSISSLKANTNASDRTFSISGVEYTNKAKLPAGLYIKNGKKVLIK